MVAIKDKIPFVVYIVERRRRERERKETGTLFQVISCALIFSLSLLTPYNKAQRKLVKEKVGEEREREEKTQGKVISFSSCFGNDWVLFLSSQCFSMVI